MRHNKSHTIKSVKKPDRMNDLAFACKKMFNSHHMNLEISYPICPNGSTSSATPPSTQALGMP